VQTSFIKHFLVSEKSPLKLFLSANDIDCGLTSGTLLATHIRRAFRHVSSAVLCSSPVREYSIAVVTVETTAHLPLTLYLDVRHII